MRFSLISSSKLRMFTTRSVTFAVLGSAFVAGAVACSGGDPETNTVTGGLNDPGAGNGSNPGGNPNGDPGPGPDLPSGPTDLTGLIDGEPEAPACSDTFAPAAARPPLIQFVVDTSGSMNWEPGKDEAPPAGTPSKWDITQQALAAAIAGMPDDVAVGLAYYPNTVQGDASCFRPEVAAGLAPLSADQRLKIKQVNDAQRPSGGTPTHGAYEFGVEQLLASPLDGPRFLLLITDGIPTYTLECSGNGRARVDGGPLIQDVQARFQNSQVRTFVIGSPGSEEARDELSAMAEVGGTANPGCSSGGPSFCHFDMTSEPDFSTALNRTLAEITQATLACDYAVPKPPAGLRIDLNQVSVVLESGGTSVREFSRAVADDCDAGWQYGAGQTSVHLCRSTCDELQGLLRDDPGLDVRIKFGCSATPR